MTLRAPVFSLVLHVYVIDSQSQRAPDNFPWAGQNIITFRRRPNTWLVLDEVHRVDCYLEITRPKHFCPLLSTMNQSCFYNTINIKIPVYRTTLSTIYSFTSVTAMVFNAFVFFTIWKTSSLHRPSYVLIANLALTDFFVGALGEPAMVMTHIAALNSWTQLFCFSWIGGRLVAYWLASVSLFTLTAMSVDRLLAVILFDRYQEIITFKRVIRFLIGSWFVLLFITTLAYFPIKKVVVLAAIIIFLLVAVLAGSYILAFQKLKRFSLAVAPISVTNTIRRETVFQIPKYRRSLNTLLWVTTTILLFYVPYICCALTTAAIYTIQPNYAQSDLLVVTYKLMTAGEVVVFINSSVNPLIYLWRMRELLAAAKARIRKCLTKLTSLNNKDTRNI